MYTFVDEPPVFPGGVAALSDYLSRSLVYPEQALRDSLEGKIYVGFVVEADGSVSEVKVLRGIGAGCDDEALRVVSEMPDWEPGKLNGVPVRVSKTFPVHFRLASLPDPKMIYLETDELPKFPGGTGALQDYLAENIKNPQLIDTAILHGMSTVYFVVEADGGISNVKIHKSSGEAQDAEALRMVKNMPRWTPGKISGINIRMLMMVPVDFGEGNIFNLVDEQPEFPGGMSQLYVYLQKNVKYPPAAMANGIQGRVFVNFVIEKDGSVSNIKVLRGIGGGCDEEAVRVAKNMPRWSPGMQKGKLVRVSFNLPIKFTLQGGVH